MYIRSDNAFKVIADDILTKLSWPGTRVKTKHCSLVPKGINFYKYFVTFGSFKCNDYLHNKVPVLVMIKNTIKCKYICGYNLYYMIK